MQEDLGQSCVPTDERARQAMAIALMAGFAERTGLSGGRPPRRYLWTDAFAVCNWLGLARARRSPELRQLAVALIDQVHHVLGQHRADDARTGWLSGLSPDEGERHPTCGGLRIGKPLPERGPGDLFDPELEWERDGQYYHYLTKWMHALDQLTRFTGDPVGNQWGRELAAAAHAGFTHRPVAGGRARMCWKMSVDLKRPLVPSMGHHDPIDGLITYLQLAAGRASDAAGPDLEREIADMARIASGRDYTTDDPLGLGGLMTDAYRLDQLVRRGARGRELIAPLLAAADLGATAYLRTLPLDRPVYGRLAFRELGLAIGLHAARRMWFALQRDPRPHISAPTARRHLEQLVGHLPALAAIESFWSRPEHQQVDAWHAHRDINEVMLATCLAPDGYLELGAPA